MIIQISPIGKLDLTVTSACQNESLIENMQSYQSGTDRVSLNFSAI